jgi:hypothetical protein
MWGRFQALRWAMVGKAGIERGDKLLMKVSRRRLGRTVR